MHRGRLSLTLPGLLLLLPALAPAGGQHAFDTYYEARKVFWKQVYPEGGRTLYCNKPFNRGWHRSINVEHVYPMGWAMKSEGCRKRKQCRASSPRFNRIEADMHNFYPARNDINKARSAFPFDMITGEQRAFGSCDFELDERRRRVEPRPAVRGNIARAMFHMKESYGLKIFRRQGEMLKRWNREDPPDADERRRNDAIARVQGTRNRFIDNPKAADKLRF
jgi:deoxyribonuclease-1